MLKRCKLRSGWGFRTHSETRDERVGIYFGNIFSSDGKNRRLSDEDVIRIYQFLGKYVNKNLKKKSNVLHADLRACANRIIKAANALEGEE